jgi:hypothetical protein
MWKQFFILVATIAFLGTSCNRLSSQRETSPTVEPLANSLTDEEKTAGWELLFDGQTLDGWKRYGADSIGPLWSVQDGILVCSGEGLGEGTKDVGGSLMTIRQFGNFELVVDWKITPGGNSGILYHVNEKPEFTSDYATGPEYQLIDDDGWKGDPLKEAQKSGSNYDMFAAPATKKLNPVGEWNTARIVYNKGHVEHYLNGEKTVEFDEDSADYQERYKKSKWVEFPGWNTFKTGSISLQDHGANVYFRNIKIKQL